MESTALFGDAAQGSRCSRVPEHSQLQDAVMRKYDTTAPTSLGTACLRTFVVVCLLSPVRLFCDPHGL